MDQHRAERVSETVREELAEIISFELSDPRLAVVDVKPQAGSREPLAEVEGLRGGVIALAAELDDLGRRADLLDARREVDALMRRLAPRGASSGL